MPRWTADNAPVTGRGRLSRPVFDDLIEVDLGPDGPGWGLLVRQMLAGDYYPPDAVRFGGRFRDEGRRLLPGDRVIQLAPMPFLPSMKLRSVVEIEEASVSESEVVIAYATTALHHGCGWWRARAWRAEGIVKLEVSSRTAPQSWLFRLFLPLARAVQMRARRRGIENSRRCFR